MATRSLTNFSPLLKSLAIMTNCLFLQQALIEEAFKDILSSDFTQDLEYIKALRTICSISDALRESMRENEKLLNALQSV